MTKLPTAPPHSGRHSPTEATYVVVNTDDFGASRGINAGILRAHGIGPVTSASLMVNMPATDDAVRRSWEVPDLSIGLHVNFTNEGVPVVPLDDESGCRGELSNQIERFRVLLGRDPTHLDSHHNIHLEYPAISEMFVEAAEELGVPLREFSGIPYVRRFYGRWDGETHPEQLTAGSLLRIIDDEIGAGLIEFSCHPGLSDPDFRSEYDGERELELDTLCSDAVRHGLADRGVELVSFGEVVQRRLWP